MQHLNAGQGTIDSSVLLLEADTPMFVKSGCQRVCALVSASEHAATAAVERNAVPLLLRVITVMPQQGDPKNQCSMLPTLSCTTTDVACEAVRALHALSSTEAGWSAVHVHRHEVIPKVERVVQQQGSSMRVEDRAVARELLHRCRCDDNNLQNSSIEV